LKLDADLLCTRLLTGVLKALPFDNSAVSDYDTTRGMNPDATISINVCINSRVTGVIRRETGEERD